MEKQMKINRNWSLTVFCNTFGYKTVSSTVNQSPGGYPCILFSGSDTTPSQVVVFSKDAGSKVQIGDAVNKAFTEMFQITELVDESTGNAQLKVANIGTGGYETQALPW